MTREQYLELRNSNKFSLDLLWEYYCNKVEEKDRKVKFGISLDPNLFNRMVKEKTNKSRLLEKLLKEYYENKDM